MDQLIGRFDATIIPTRPCEGDLIYFPLTKGLFEIKFVKHQDPFYQLGKLYVYKLQVELFQYSSERLDTGIREVDAFESLKTFSTDTTRSAYGYIQSFRIDSQGMGYTTATISIESNYGWGAAATPVIEDGKVVSINVVSGGQGYNGVEQVSVRVDGDGEGATATAIVSHNIDAVDSFGDNNEFKQQGDDFVFNENNPFGDV
jgi:hypothetical protein